MQFIEVLLGGLKHKFMEATLLLVRKETFRLLLGLNHGLKYLLHLLLNLSYDHFEFRFLEEHFTLKSSEGDKMLIIEIVERGTWLRVASDDLAGLFKDKAVIKKLLHLFSHYFKLNLYCPHHLFLCFCLLSVNCLPPLRDSESR